MCAKALLLAQKLLVPSTCNCLDMHIASVAFDQVVPVVIANKLTLFSCRSRGISSRLASQQMPNTHTQIYKTKVNIHKWLSNNLPLIHLPLKERLFDRHLCILTFFFLPDTFLKICQNSIPSHLWMYVALGLRKST